MATTVVKVRDVMSSDIKTLARNDKLAIADEIMKQERIRHLPVLDDDGYVCGIVSQRDLFRGALLRSLGYGSRAEDMMLNKLVVKEVMKEDPETTSPNTSLAEAGKLMLDRKIGCLPVLENDKLIGILSESDFVKCVVNEAAPS